MTTDMHYLQAELYQQVHEDTLIFDFLQNGSLDGIWYWDLENPENEWMSPRFWEVLGYSPAEKEHSPSAWQDLLHPEDLDAVQRNFDAHCADAGHPYDQVVRYRHKDGSTVWIRCRGLAIRNDDGKVVRMLGAHTNVTELKIAEQRIQALMDELSKTNETANLELESLAGKAYSVRAELTRIVQQTRQQGASLEQLSVDVERVIEWLKS